METIKYKDLEIIPIMREMLVWDGDEEENAIKMFVTVKVVSPSGALSYKCIRDKGFSVSYQYAKEIPQSETKPRTIQNGLQYGDIITNKVSRRRVLGIYGDVIFTSIPDKFHTAGASFTQKELTLNGWELEQPTPEPKSITIQEAQELLKEKGIDNIKIQ